MIHAIIWFFAICFCIYAIWAIFGAVNDPNECRAIFGAVLYEYDGPDEPGVEGFAAERDLRPAAKTVLVRKVQATR